MSNTSKRVITYEAVKKMVDVNMVVNGQEIKFTYDAEDATIVERILTYQEKLAKIDYTSTKALQYLKTGLDDLFGVKISKQLFANTDPRQKIVQTMEDGTKREIVLLVAIVEDLFSIFAENVPKTESAEHKKMAEVIAKARAQ